MGLVGKDFKNYRGKGSIPNPFLRYAKRAGYTLLALGTLASIYFGLDNIPSYGYTGMINVDVKNGAVLADYIPKGERKPVERCVGYIDPERAHLLYPKAFRIDDNKGADLEITFGASDELAVPIAYSD